MELVTYDHFVAAITSPFELVELAHGDPTRALALIESYPIDGRPEDAAAPLSWAAGIAHRELGDLDQAEQCFQLAVASAGTQEMKALVSSSLALVHLGRGDLAEALRLVDSAGQHLSDAAWSRNEMQRGLVLQRQGDLGAAMTSYDRAEPGLAGDRPVLVRLLNNRALIAGYLGNYQSGANDLVNAHAIAVADGQLMSAASCAANLGFMFGRIGDVPLALDWFARSEALFEALGIRDTRRAVLKLDRAEVEAAAGLLHDARADAVAASEQLVSLGSMADAAEAELLAARLAMADSDLGEAKRLASLAVGRFEEQSRPAWSAQARFVEFSARSAMKQATPDEALGLLGMLDSLGWESEAQRARIDYAVVLIDAGDLESARELVAPGGVATSEPAVLAAHRWYATALMAIAEGEVGEARSALASGLAVLDEYRNVLGSPELRAHASVLGRDLIGRAVELAVASGRGWDVLATVESWRAASLHMPPVRPPDDAAIAADLASLRTVDSKVREAVACGTDPGELMSRRTHLESKIRRSSHASRGTGDRRVGFNRRELNKTLDSKTLIAYFRDGDRLGAVAVENGRSRLVDLAPAEHVAREVRSLVFLLHRMASGMGSSASQAAAVETFRQASQQLADLVMLPIEPTGDGLVIVPTGVLNRMPWQAIVEDRAVSLAPSVGSWLRSMSSWTRLDGRSKVALIAGPELPGARGEVVRLARRYPNRVRLTGRNATSAALLAALDGADIAHIAAHGSFRSDNPLFSSLRLHDGPFTVYDLARIQHPPSLVVLPSCDSGVNDVMEGDEILGLSAALLGMGVSSLVAPVVPVPDDATARLMVALHGRLADGMSPSTALSEAIGAHPRASPVDLAVRAAFVAMGV